MFPPKANCAAGRWTLCVRPLVKIGNSLPQQDVTSYRVTVTVAARLDRVTGNSRAEQSGAAAAGSPSICSSTKSLYCCDKPSTCCLEVARFESRQCHLVFRCHIAATGYGVLSVTLQRCNGKTIPTLGTGKHMICNNLPSSYSSTVWQITDLSYDPELTGHSVCLLARHLILSDVIKTPILRHEYKLRSVLLPSSFSRSIMYLISYVPRGTAVRNVQRSTK